MIQEGKSAVLFDSIPLNIRAMHEADAAGSRINGGHVFYSAAVEAVVKYSAFDEFWFFDNMVPTSFPLFSAGGDSKRHKPIKIVGPRDVQTIFDGTCALLMTSTEDPGKLVPLRRMGGPNVLPITGHLCAANESWIIRPLMAMMLGGFGEYDAMICPTHASRRALERLIESVATLGGLRDAQYEMPFQRPVVPIGIDCTEFGHDDRESARRSLGLAADTTMILYFGKLDPYGKSDLGSLLLAFKALLDRWGKKVVLTLAGTDPNNEWHRAVATFAQEVGCGGSTSVMPNPRETEKKTLFAAADVFLSLSEALEESFGITVVEAMASGIPTVCSDWNGYREVVVDKETGFLVPTTWCELGCCTGMLELYGLLQESTIAATTAVNMDGLIQSLDYLVANAELRKEMGARGKRRAMDLYDWPNVVRQYEEVWANLSDRARRSRVHPLPTTNELQRVFSHYPTTITEESTFIGSTARAQNWLHNGFPLGIDVATRFPIIDTAVARALILLLQEHGHLTVKEILDGLQSTGVAPRWLSSVHLARLLKYGLCTVVPIKTAIQDNGH